MPAAVFFGTYLRRRGVWFGRVGNMGFVRTASGGRREPRVRRRVLCAIARERSRNLFAASGKISLRARFYRSSRRLWIFIQSRGRAILLRETRR
jgi:hypothetical protein